MSAKLDQSGTNNTIKFLNGRTSEILMSIGEETKRELTTQWLKGNGGNGIKFPDLRDPYKSRKPKGIKTGGQYRKGKPIPDLMLTGALQRGLTLIKKGSKMVDVTFVKGEQRKAEGNATTRPNMMKVNDKFKDKARKFYQKALNNFLKRTP